MSYLSIQGLHKSYGSTAIFSDINCEIGKGEFITLLGPSGCGKSTLLRCIAGLTGVNGGQIRLDGQDLVPVAPQKRGIGMVFQSYALFPNMTVQQNVAFGLRMQKVKGSEAEQRVKEVLELVELNDFAERYPQQLSGGQCQRVALARSLGTPPRPLLLGEPPAAPADAFAAGFIGNYNLLDAATASHLLGRPIGSRVAIRPEAIQIGAQGSIQAQIRSHSLLGNVIRYRVEARGVELLVDVLNLSASDMHASGQHINLNIEDNAICEVA